MFCHVVIFSWNDPADEYGIAKAIAALHALQPEVDGLEEVMAGPDLGLQSGQFGARLGISSGKGDIGVVMIFSDQAAWDRYNQAEVHESLVKDKLAPFLAGRISVQFELPAKTP